MREMSRRDRVLDAGEKITRVTCQMPRKRLSLLIAALGIHLRHAALWCRPRQILDQLTFGAARDEDEVVSVHSLSLFMVISVVDS